MAAVYGNIYEFESLPKAQFRNAVARTGDSARRASAVPLVGIIRNPRSHRNKNNAPEMADCSNILTETPKTRQALRKCLSEFADRGIDYLVVDGGDGTVRDVLTCGADVFGDNWPALVVLPKGKTNALAVDIGLPNQWSLAEALAAARDGDTISRRPIRITAVPGPDDATDIESASCVQGFIMGAGAFTIGTEAGQAAHRYGAFNSFAVGLTVLWGVMQALFGGKRAPWRALTPMRIFDRSTGRSVPRRGPGNPDERYLAVATTFENFPLGACPFGSEPPSGLKLALIDSPVRRVMMMMPAILFGYQSKALKRNGVHRIASPAFEIDLGGAFILDGEAFPAGRYIVEEGPQLTFVVP